MTNPHEEILITNAFSSINWKNRKYIETENIETSDLAIRADIGGCAPNVLYFITAYASPFTQRLFQ